MKHIILIKRQVLLGHDAHYAGGVHLFSCLARTLSTSGWNVQVFTICSKHLLLHYAALNGLLQQLQPSVDNSSLISWQAHGHPVCSGDRDKTRKREAVQLLIKAAVNHAHQLTKQHLHPPVVLLDSDALQHVVLPAVAGDCNTVESSRHTPSVNNSTTSDTHSKRPLGCLGPQQPFLQALMDSLHQSDWQQAGTNAATPISSDPAAAGQASRAQSGHARAGLHHLPFGPGRPRVLPDVWLSCKHGSGSMASYVCLQFVAGLRRTQHALPLLCLGTSSSGIKGGPLPVHVVPPGSSWSIWLMGHFLI